MNDIAYAIVRCNAYLIDGDLCQRTTTFPVAPETRVAALRWKCPTHSLKHIGKCYCCGGSGKVLEYDGRIGGIVCADCLGKELDNHRAEG